MEKAAEVVRHRGDGTIAILRALLERLADDRFEIGVEGSPRCLRHGRRLDLDNRLYQLRGRTPCVAGRMVAAEECVEEDAERVHVSTGGNARARHLLRRRILRRHRRASLAREITDRFATTALLEKFGD